MTRDESVDWGPLYDAALPVDAPGAWIRRAIIPARLHMRVMTEDGRTLADDDVTLTNVETLGVRHANAAVELSLDRGIPVWLEVTDPDGVIGPLVMRVEP